MGIELNAPLRLYLDQLRHSLNVWSGDFFMKLPPSAFQSYDKLDFALILPSGNISLLCDHSIWRPVSLNVVCTAIFWDLNDDIKRDLVQFGFAGLVSVLRSGLRPRCRREEDLKWPLGLKAESEEAAQQMIRELAACLCRTSQLQVFSFPTKRQRSISLMQVASLLSTW